MILNVHHLGMLLELEGNGDSAMLYLGYIEVNLQIPGIKGYNRNVLLQVILTTTHSEKAPVVVRSKIIDMAKGMMTKGGLVRAIVTWKQVHFCVVMSRSLQLPHKDSKGKEEVVMGVTSFPGSDHTASREFCPIDEPTPVPEAHMSFQPMA